MHKKREQGRLLQSQSQLVENKINTPYVTTYGSYACDWLKSFWNVFSKSIQTDDFQCAISIHLDYAIILINVNQCTSRILLHTIKNLYLYSNRYCYVFLYLVPTLSCFCGVTSCITVIGKSTSRPCLYKYTLHMLPYAIMRCYIVHT